MAVVKNLMVRCGADFSALTKATKKAQGSMSSMQKSATMLGATMKKLAAVVSVVALARFGKSCIDAASDLQEVQNVVDVTFGSMSGQIDDFAKNAITQFGMSETAAKQYTGTMGAMLKSMGLTTKQAAGMSMEITGLAGDMASFYNLKTDEAFAKIRSGISGETEPLKQLGINMSITNLQAYAMSQGITKSYKSMTQAEQATLRYNYLLSVTSDAQGDLSRTSGSWANQVRILSEQFNSLKVAIGTGLIQALTPVIQIINKVMAKLVSLANTFSAVTAALFGKQKAAASASASATETAADAQNDLATGIGNASKASKDAQKNMSGLDEMNTFQVASASSGSGDSSGAAGGVAFDAIETPEIDTSKTEASLGKLAGVMERLKKIDLTPLTESFERLKGVLGTFGENISIGLEWLLNNVLLPLANWTITDVLPTFIDILSGALSVVNEVVSALQPLGSWLWDSFLKPIAEWTGGVIVDVLTDIGDGLTAISEWAKEHKKTIENITIVAGSFAAAWGLVNLALNAWNIGVALWNAIGPIATIVTGAFGSAIGFLTSPIGIVTIAIGAIIAIVVLLAKNWDKVKEVAANVWENIKAVWQSVSDWFKQKIIDPLSNAWNNFKTLVINVWSGIWNGIKGAINWIIGGINGMISGVVSGVNTVIRALNKVKFDVPSWVPLLGGKSFGISINEMRAPQIPMLANGAVIPPNREFMAVLGDQRNGRNLETPESLLRQIVREESGGRGNTNLIATANGRVLFQFLISEAKAEQMRTGRNPFLLTT